MNGNGENIIAELEELSEQNLIRDFKIFKNDLNTCEFIIITLEDIDISLETSTNYCYKVLNHNDNFLYESFEQLLTKYSEAYSNKFGEIITNKLNALINGQEKDK